MAVANGAPAGDIAPFGELHTKMSRKIAQLTKVCRWGGGIGRSRERRGGRRKRLLLRVNTACVFHAKGAPACESPFARHKGAPKP